MVVWIWNWNWKRTRGGGGGSTHQVVTACVCLGLEKEEDAFNQKLFTRLGFATLNPRKEKKRRRSVSIYESWVGF
ncbi:hypothetical protein Hanom_Chr10g00872281 [Helianthus anomalus]